MVAAIAVASAGLGMLAGVAMASRAPANSSAAQPWRHGAALSSAPRCATCGGTGKEDCRLCARWSDAGSWAWARGGGGDRSGCGVCAGTRRAPCRSCGGSGTGRRAPVRVAAAGPRTLRPVTRAR